MERSGVDGMESGRGDDIERSGAIDMERSRVVGVGRSGGGGMEMSMATTWRLDLTCCLI